jgi:hypothetical protein
MSHLPHIMVIPPLLTDYNISQIRKSHKIKKHHDDDGHGVTSIEKPNFMPIVARLFGAYIGYRVDHQMKLYHLLPGKGAVPSHVDLDYEDKLGVATHSLLIHLNDDYEGGETLFDPELAPEVKVGGGLLFNHKILHSARDVVSGEKYILKTDVFQYIEG